MTPTTSTEDLLPGSIVLKSITIDQQGRKWDLVFRPAEGVHPNTLSSFVANSSGAIPELSLGSWLGSGSNGTVWEVSVPAEKHLLFAAKFSHVPSKGVTEERQSRAAQRLAKEASTYSDLHQLRPECVPKIARYFGLWTAVVPANWAFIPWIRPEFRSSTGPLTVALIILEKLGKSITRSDLFISESQAASEDISVYESRLIIYRAYADLALLGVDIEDVAASNILKVLPSSSTSRTVDFRITGLHKGRSPPPEALAARLGVNNYMYMMVDRAQDDEILIPSDGLRVLQMISQGPRANLQVSQARAVANTGL